MKQRKASLLIISLLLTSFLLPGCSLFNAPVLTTLELTPPEATFGLGEELTLTVTGQDDIGNPLILSEPQWEIIGNSSATLTPQGLTATVSSTTFETFTVQVVVDQLSQTAEITVGVTTENVDQLIQTLNTHLQNADGEGFLAHYTDPFLVGAGSDPSNSEYQEVTHDQVRPEFQLSGDPELEISSWETSIANNIATVNAVLHQTYLAVEHEVFVNTVWTIEYVEDALYITKQFTYQE